MDSDQRTEQQETGGHPDTERLEFILRRMAFLSCTRTDAGGVAYQLMEQNEDEEYIVLSGDRAFFNNPRAAIDAALDISKGVA